MAEEVVSCPICGLPEVDRLGRVESRDAFGFECRRCGRFIVSGSALAGALGQLEAPQRFRISGATRRASEAGDVLDLGGADIKELLDTPRGSRPLLAKADAVLLYLAENATRHFEPIEFDLAMDFPLLGFESEDEMEDALIALRNLGYVDSRKGTRIGVGGWKRVEELRATQPESRKAFVAMWFAGGMDEAWRDGFDPGIRDTGYFEPVRGDSGEHTDRIDDWVIAEIRTSGLVVADFTGHRGSVYFEAGLASGLGIPVIWCCREDHFEDAQFDTRQYNHIVWKTPEDLRSQLTTRILAVVPAATQG